MTNACQLYTIFGAAKTLNFARNWPIKPLMAHRTQALIFQRTIHPNPIQWIFLKWSAIIVCEFSDLGRAWMLMTNAGFFFKKKLLATDFYIQFLLCSFYARRLWLVTAKQFKFVNDINFNQLRKEKIRNKKMHTHPDEKSEEMVLWGLWFQSMPFMKREVNSVPNKSMESDSCIRVTTTLSLYV